MVNHRLLSVMPPAIACIILTCVLSHCSVQAGVITGSQSGGASALQETERQLRALLKESGEQPYLMRELGRVLYRQGRESLAKQLWDRAAERDPNLADSTVELIYAKLAGGDTEDASQRLRNLDFESSRDPHVLIAAAELALVTRDVEKAEEFIAKAHGLAPEIEPTNVAMGFLLETQGDLEEAQTYYRRATEIVPDHPVAWIKLGNIHFRENRIAEAREMFAKAEKCLGPQPLAETRIGELHFLKGNFFQAHRSFQQAIERDEEDPFPRFRLGQSLERAGRLPEARQEYEQVLEGTEYAVALKALARLDFLDNRLAEARDLYRRAITRNPKDVLACNNLAMILVQLDESPDEAMILIERAMGQMSTGPSDALVSTYGCVLCFAKKFSQAESTLAAAVQKQPNLSWNRYSYGVVLTANGKQPEAREQFEACLWLDPDFPRKKEIEKIVAGEISPQ